MRDAAATSPRKSCEEAKVANVGLHITDRNLLSQTVQWTCQLLAKIHPMPHEHGKGTLDYSGVHCTEPVRYLRSLFDGHRAYTESLTRIFRLGILL
jgi:hypothetical protein